MIEWSDLQVAPDRTHHVLNGRPAYDVRFLEVLKFHAPGLAPALSDDGAMHIGCDGRPAYRQRYQRTFGFYEGLAAVQAEDGWHHVRRDGEAHHADRYAWCGNYQGGRCTVRQADGSYFHLTSEGSPAYTERWRYAGDFRDGIAVVQRDDGLHSHIDACGALVHGRWFVDLDVFHKGFARARNRAGWTHIDATGRPVHQRRFAAVEPFYNGQARVERFDGGLEVVDEGGRMLVELRPARRSEFAALSADLVGFWRTDAVAGAVRLGVPRALPGTTAQVAERLTLDSGRLDALLRALCELRLVECRGAEWHLTGRGAYLLPEHPWTLADAALEYAGPLRDLWGALPDALADARWHPPDVFADVAEDPLRTVSHHRMLRSYARHDYPLIPAALGLRGDERVLDVGGGVGVLAELLLDAHPRLDVVILDRPEVVAQLPTRPGLEGIAADLFGTWPIQADVAVLARVLHDWDQERAVALLRNVHGALPRGGQVFVVEMLVAEDGAFGGLCDLHLLMATGGRERTQGEYAELMDQADFELTEVRALSALPTVLVGVAR